MHADNYLWRKFVAVSWLQRHSWWSWRSKSLLLMQRYSLWCQDVAFDANVIKCIDDCLWCQKNCIWFQTIKCIDDCLNFSLTEDLCEDSFINSIEKKTKKKIKFVFKLFKLTLYCVNQRFNYENCFFLFIRFDFSKNSEILVFINWKSIQHRFYHNFWSIRDIFFTAAIHIILIIYWKV